MSTRRFQVGDRVRHSTMGLDGTVAVTQYGLYELRELSNGSPVYYASPSMFTLIRPASERPPQVGDVYFDTGSGGGAQLLSETQLGWHVRSSGSTIHVTKEAAARLVRVGHWRLKTPGKGSVEQEAAVNSSTVASKPLSTKLAPAFEVGGAVEYETKRLVPGETAGAYEYRAGFQTLPIEKLRDAINAMQYALRALHAPPAVCADCGKGPAVAMGTPEERTHLCAYCERRHFPRTMRESLPSAVAALPDKPGPNEGACAWSSADYESDW